MENIEAYEKYLAKDYAPELIKFYEERLIKYVDKYSGRDYYQKACKYLRRMRK